MRVLVIEDDVVTSRVISRFVIKCDCEVHAVSNGVEALEALSRGFDLILCDVLMPVMDGPTFLRHLKTDEEYSRFRQIPVIMVSICEEFDTVVWCLSNGAFDYLLKPVEQQLLRDRIKTAKRHRPEQQIPPAEIVVPSLAPEVEDAPVSNPGSRHVDESLMEASLIKKNAEKLISSMKVTEASIPGLSLRGADKIRAIEVAVEEYIALLPPNERHEVRRRRSVPQTVEFPVRESAIIRARSFDAMQYTSDELQDLSFRMFCEEHLLPDFRISVPVLKEFLKKTRMGYFPNPYHNYHHAVDVTQFLMMLLKLTDLRAWLTPLDKLALLTGALCHDLEHPGVNNYFLINSLDDIALFYNDQSALENYHLFKMFELIKQEHCNIFSGLSKEDFKAIRKKIIVSILATDMAHHFRHVQQIRTRLGTQVPFDCSRSESDKELLMTLVMKAADISNACRPFPIYTKWADGITAEIIQQNKRERDMKLPISQEIKPRVQMQIDFLSYIVEPTFALLSEILPGASPCLEGVIANRRHWESIKQGERTELDILAEEVKKMKVSG
eukprot:gnl/Trimastix_PCT/4673.p1 GENE.gnl/Trimastix_PCT/4673~~gnl/Trimastix_PCT/4673.p1  ORF type:complete len:555 (+),score=81.76 gnl/Trimastix_PCT/4673:90-1754(+)